MPNLTAVHPGVKLYIRITTSLTHLQLQTLLPASTKVDVSFFLFFLLCLCYIQYICTIVCTVLYKYKLIPTVYCLIVLTRSFSSPSEITHSFLNTAPPISVLIHAYSLQYMYMYNRHTCSAELLCSSSEAEYLGGFSKQSRSHYDFTTSTSIVIK